MLRFFLLVITSLIPAIAMAGQVTDLAGRTVAIPDRVERIILGEGRYIPAIAILDRDNPIERIVGMMGDYQQLDPASYAKFNALFPALAGIQRIGRSSAESFSLEQAIALNPQVAVLGIDGHGPGSGATEVVTALESAGVAVVFVDFRRDPIVNTPKSMALLGRVLGREAEAAEFLDIWKRELGKVTSRLAEHKPPPVKTFIESRVGLSAGCCETMVRGMAAGFVDKAGGKNLAADIVPGHAGTVSLEYLLTNQPDLYIGTAIGAAASDKTSPQFIALGASVAEETARASLLRAVSRSGIRDLDAVKSGRAFALWHHFYNSPFNVAAVQAIAKWQHPELFADLDPDALLRELFHRFQPFEQDGVYWVSLK
jgi:iron complex transport system substrate-binding protein